MIAGAASYVDRILRDALPNCLFKPQPNLSWSCAKKLCAIRPATAPALLARADEVISRDAMSALAPSGRRRILREGPLLWEDRISDIRGLRSALPVADMGLSLNLRPPLALTMCYFQSARPTCLQTGTVAP
jgi:hypothetical protein